jgi:hypothetical protein
MNVKPGILAYIVESPFPENVGRVVEVLSAYGEYRDEGFCWNVCSKFPLTAILDIGVGIVCTREAFTPDRCLRPISGVPVHDELTDEV